MSDGLRMPFLILLTARTDCLAIRARARAHFCLAVLLARGTAHTACLRLTGCTRSSFLCGKLCVMGMILWNSLMDTGAISTVALKICAADFCFPKGRGAAAALSLYLYLQQLYDSASTHTPDTVSLCSSHQIRPRMPASVCLAALVVPSFVVGICVSGMISWNALQDTQPRRIQNDIFVCALLLCTIIYLLQVPNQLLHAVYLDAVTVKQQLHFKHSPV